MNAAQRCPTCRKPLSSGAGDPRWRPFCSERCRLIDLGNWMNGSHRIAADDAYCPPEQDPDPDPLTRH
ncbi:MAG: DNA gyrase inhibitor YacG [Gammaproteobacteria bacterium]|nr:DNA gyrase inhibitor YacG [Gammaproteobacteria bacterium]